MILLYGCVVCVCVSSNPCVINKVVSVCLNHTALCSRVNMRVNGKDSYGIVSVFSVRPPILNNNDFLMWNCDYIVTVKYGSSWPHWKWGPKRELLQQHRLQRCARWGNLHKFKSNLNRAGSVMEKDFTEERQNRRRHCPELRLLRWAVKSKESWSVVPFKESFDILGNTLIHNSSQELVEEILIEISSYFFNLCKTLYALMLSLKWKDNNPVFYFQCTNTPLQIVEECQSNQESNCQALSISSTISFHWSDTRTSFRLTSFSRKLN